MKALRRLRVSLMNRSFFTKLFASICFVVFIGNFAMIAVYQFYFRKTMEDVEMERVQRSIDQTAYNLDSQLKRIVNDMNYFFLQTNTANEMLKLDVRSPDFAQSALNIGKSLEVFRLRYSSELESAFFYREDEDRSGGLFFFDENLSRNREIDYRQQEWYRIFRQKSYQLWTRPTTDHVFYQDRSLWSLWLTKGIYDVDGRSGILVVRLNAKMFSDAFRHIVGNDLRIDLLNSHGDIIYSSYSPPTAGLIRVQNAELSQLGSTVESREEDSDWLPMVSNLENADILVRAQVSRKAIVDRANRLNPFHIAVMVAVLAMSFLISLLLSIMLVRPVKTLLGLMKKVETGNFNVRFPVRYRDEISLLGAGFNRMIERLSELIRQVYVIRMEKMELELHQKEATILALQNQINPHFLYNTLETINCHAILNDLPSISHMSKALADFFRYSIDNRSIEATLGDELHHVMTYLKIQRERMPDIETVFNVPDDLLDAPIVKLTLQPLIENAYKHAFRGDRYYYLHLYATHSGDGVFQVVIEDNGEGMEEQKIQEMNRLFSEAAPSELSEHPDWQRNSIGLLNVHFRIRLRYGKPFGLSLAESASGGLQVCLTLPDRKKMRETEQGGLHDESVGG